MSSPRRTGAAAAMIMGLLVLAYLVWKRSASADDRSVRDKIDDLLIDGARVQGKHEEADRLEAAKEDDNTWSTDEKVQVAAAAIAMLIIFSIIGFELAGTWGAVAGAIIGIAVGILGGWGFVEWQDQSERAAAEKAIIAPPVPGIGGEAPSD